MSCCVLLRYHARKHFKQNQANLLSCTRLQEDYEISMQAVIQIKILLPIKWE